MIPVYAPEIARVVDLGAALLGGAPAGEVMRAAVEEAKRFHHLSRQRFTFACASAPMADAQVQILLPQIEEQFEARGRALQRLGSAGADDLAGLLDTVQETSHALMELTGQLRQRQDAVPLLSPMPRIDELIRIGANVYNGDYPADALAGRLPAVVSMVASLEEDGRLFRASHPAEDALAAELDEDVGDLQTAVGALYTYLDGGQREDLLLGLRLAGVASANVDRDLRRMDEVARSRGLSPNPYLNVLQARLEAGDAEGWAAAVEDVRRWLEREVADLERIPRDFLVGPKLYEERLQPLEALLAEAEACFMELESPAEDTVHRLADVAARMDEAGARLFEDLRARRDYGADLDAAQLSEVVRGVADGVVPQATLSHQLERVQQRNRALSRRLAALRSDAELRETRRALLGELQALEVLGEFMGTGDTSLLARGLEMFDRQHGSVLGIEDLLARKELDQTTVACVRCATRNVGGSSYCNRCRAPLPMTEEVSLSSLDIVAHEHGLKMGEAAEASGELFDEVEAVCRAFQRGEAGAPEVAAVLELIESRLEMNRRQFAQHVAPTLQQDAALSARAAAFEAALQGLDEGTRIIRHAVIGGPEGWLGSVDDGLARLSDGAERMSRLRE